MSCRRRQQEIIQKQIEEHKSFELKTEYSKEKYLKRKEAKCAHCLSLSLSLPSPAQTDPTCCARPLPPTDGCSSSRPSNRPCTRSPSSTLRNRRSSPRRANYAQTHSPTCSPWPTCGRGAACSSSRTWGGMIVAAAVERMGGASRQPPLSLFVILAPAHARLTPAPREGHRHAQARAAS